MAHRRVSSIWVDFNSRRDGYVPSRVDDADGPIAVGCYVHAWDEFEDGLRAVARVVSVDDGGLVLLDVLWETIERGIEADDTAVNLVVSHFDDLPDDRMSGPEGRRGWKPVVRSAQPVA